jgi:hypothetical protein
MKFRSIPSTFLCLIVAFANLAGDAQEKSNVTPEEKAAAEKLSDQFIQQLVRAGDIEPVTNTLFVQDFIRRLSDESKHQNNEDDMWPIRTLGLPGNIDLAVFENASPDEMRQYFLGRFRLMNYGLMVSMNRYANAQRQGKDLDDDSFFSMYPSSVMQRLEKDPYLANLIIKKNLQTKPVATIEDLRTVNKTLAEVSNMLSTKENADRAVLSKEAIAMIPNSRQIVKEKFGYPVLSDIPGEHFGFPKGTRLIVAFASVGHMLVITKIDSEYKIVYAGVGSPD